MEKVDDKFWLGMRPIVRKIIETTYNSLSRRPTNSLDDLVEYMMEALLKSRNTVFIHTPGV
jgi:hypothetical protein